MEYDADKLQWGIDRLYKEYENFDLDELAETIKHDIREDLNRLAHTEEKKGSNIEWKDILFNKFPWDGNFETTLDHLIDSPDTISRMFAVLLLRHNDIHRSLLILKALYNYDGPAEVKKNQISEIDKICYTSEAAVKAIIVRYLQSGKLFPVLTGGGNAEKLFAYLFGVLEGSVKKPLERADTLYEARIMPDNVTEDPYKGTTKHSAIEKIRHMAAAKSVFDLFDKCIPQESKETKVKIKKILKDIDRKIMCLESK